MGLTQGKFIFTKTFSRSAHAISHDLNFIEIPNIKLGYDTNKLMVLMLWLGSRSSCSELEVER